jgi:hypothetical protein
MPKALSRGTAFHEAGHAVVAWSHRLPVAAIYVRDDESGRTEIAGADQLEQIDHIALLAAGYTAENIFKCWAAAPLAAHLDHGMIALMLTKANIPKENHPAVIKLANERAGAILRRQEDKVLLLVDRLVESGYVDHAEFLRLMAS